MAFIMLRRMNIKSVTVRCLVQILAKIKNELKTVAKQRFHTFYKKKWRYVNGIWGAPSLRVRRMRQTARHCEAQRAEANS